MNPKRRNPGSFASDAVVIAFLIAVVLATGVILGRYANEAETIQKAIEKPLFASLVAISLLVVVLLLSAWLYGRAKRLRTWARIAAFVSFSLAYWAVVGWLMYAAAALLPGDLSLLQSDVAGAGEVREADGQLRSDGAPATAADGVGSGQQGSTDGAAPGKQFALSWAIVALAIGMFIAGKLVWPTEKPAIEDDYGDIVGLMGDHVLVRIDGYAEAALDEIVDPNFIDNHSVRFRGGHRAVVKSGIIARWLIARRSFSTNLDEEVLFQEIASNLLYRWFLRLGRTEDLGSTKDFINGYVSCAAGINRLDRDLNERARTDAKLDAMLSRFVPQTAAAE